MTGDPAASPGCAAAAGHLTVPIRAEDRFAPRIGSLCTGIGGLDIATLAVLGGRLAWAADPDPAIATVLQRRFPEVPNHGDINCVDWASLEPVDVLTAGFPCQDISAAGRRVGIAEGTRSGLWYRVVDAIRALRPALVFVENVAALRWKNGGLGIVLGDLASSGYDAIWHSVRASDLGACHRRERVFLLAWPADDQPEAPPHALCERSSSCRAGSRPPEGNGTSDHPQRRDSRPQPHASSADPDCSRFPLLRDPDCAEIGSPDTDRLRHADRRASAAPDAVGVQSERWRAAGDLASTTRQAESRRRPGDDAAGDCDRPVARGARGPRSSFDHDVDWGAYEDAIRRWEWCLGRPAPNPAEAGRNGRPRLAAPLVEWMMGYPDGWVTDLPLTRTAQLHALGNSVMPQQAVHALRILLARRASLTALASITPAAEAA